MGWVLVIIYFIYIRTAVPIFAVIATFRPLCTLTLLRWISIRVTYPTILNCTTRVRFCMFHCSSLGMSARFYFYSTLLIYCSPISTGCRYTQHDPRIQQLTRERLHFYWYMLKHIFWPFLFKVMLHCTSPECHS